MRDTVANLFVLTGLAMLVVAAWLIHPSAGLTVAGLAAAGVGVGIVRSKA